MSENTAFTKAKKKLHNIIEAAGGRHTTERETVLEVIYAQNQPVSIDTLLELVNEIFEVKRASIYYICNYLVEKGLIAKRGTTKGKGDAKAKALYEGVIGQNLIPNAICRDCGKVIAFDNEHVSKIREGLMRLGFLLPKHAMNFDVECKDLKKHGKCQYKT